MSVPTELLDAFESAWQTGKPPRIEDYLSATPKGPARLELIAELVKLDLEYAWRQAAAAGRDGPLLDQYLRRWPELGGLLEAAPDLIAEEYWVRQHWGDHPSHAEYLRRFARHGASLTKKLARIDRELRAEFAQPANNRAAPAPTARPVGSAVHLLDTLQRLQLLPPRQQKECVDKLCNRFTDPQALGRELVQRGWLTVYQVNQLLLGHGDQLSLGPYVLQERLGEGSTGLVYKALHQRLQRLTALKVIRSELVSDADVLGRFYREVRILSGLSHPHIVQAYDAGPIGPCHVLAMEYVDGTDLDRLVKQSGRFPFSRACDYIRQAALGLQYAHERTLVHRDIKPSNLLVGGRVTGGEGRQVVKILDLGLARLRPPMAKETVTMLFSADWSTMQTPAGSVMLGTPDFLAPEQAVNFHAADIRADIYSLGCTLYFLLAGRPPFPGGSQFEKLVRHQQEEPPAIDRQRPDLPAGLGQVLQRMLAKRPQDRYQTPGEVAEALTALLPPAQRSAQRAALPAGRRPPRRRAWLVAGILTGLLLLGGGVALFAPRPDESDAVAGTGRKPGGMERPEKDFVNSLRMKLVLIPDGKFLMGAPRNEPKSMVDLPDQDLHEVVIGKPFYMAAHHVTVGQFRSFVEATGPRPPPSKDGKSWQAPGFDQTDEYPVVFVTWDDAQAFCRWLSQKEGRVYRLPTEAEWEFACRAGKQTTYFFGNDARQLGEYAWYNGNAKHTQPVGRRKANAHGLFDMLGNAWQWTADAAGNNRVLRGGSYVVDAGGCRCATRKGRVPGYATPHSGFRVVCDVGGPP
jgi:eukaryotic-like serine/threonine-protein kinase